MVIRDVNFIISAYALQQLPPPELPEIAFAGRSNVGKSSLINKLVNRRNLVKVSSKPGKTRSLNFFRVNIDFYLVDLPGYGFARTSKKTQKQWQELISTYIETRDPLRCVVVIIDIRHDPKAQDLELVAWLRMKKLPFLLVYTKIDKLSGNKLKKQASLLDTGFNVTPEFRVLFSAKSGEGRENLLSRLDLIIS